MRISIKTEYALRAVIELAAIEDNIPLSIREICERQKLPMKFIEQLFRQLKKQEIIKSIQGSKGGYLLNDSLENINLNHIMTALDDNYKTRNCTLATDHKYCSGKDCKINHTLIGIQKDLEDYFSNITLKRIMDEGDCHGENISG